MVTNETGNMPIDRQTAVRRLTNRCREQCDLSPTLANDIPLKLYIRRNVGHVMREGLLESYNLRS